jgi:hypothetical protein
MPLKSKEETDDLPQTVRRGSHSLRRVKLMPVGASIPIATVVRCRP